MYILCYVYNIKNKVKIRGFCVMVMSYTIWGEKMANKWV